MSIEEQAGDDLRKELHDAVVRMEDRINSATAPNFGTIWAACGVLATVLIAIGAIVSSGFVREMERQDKSSEDVDKRHVREEGMLDERLQREYHQITETVTEKISAVRVGDEERHLERVRLFEQLDHRLRTMEEWQSDRVKADLEELRRRRMGEKIP